MIRSGQGMRGTVDGRETLIGNRLPEDVNVETVALNERAEALRNQGQIVILAAVDGRPAGATGIADPIKPTAFEAVRLSDSTMRNIHQNLFFAFIYNALGSRSPLACCVILLSPMIAAAAMSLSSVSVIGNALRLRRAEL